MQLLFCLACASAVVLLGSCFPAPLTPLTGDNTTADPTGAGREDLALATKYLQHFYNFESESVRRRRSRSSFASRLKDMQSFFGLRRTGKLDSDTLVVMKTPRCGVPDVEDYIHNHKNGWRKNVLSYSIGKYTIDLPASIVDSLLASALNVWAKVSPLTFYRTYSPEADIMVEFASNGHGDSYPFDGPGGTLAHAFGPGEGIGGDVHFDEDEVWTAGSKGFNLYLVAAHEFGHALGLRHSKNPESVMYPTYRLQKSSNLLSSEDVMNINALYGVKSTRPTYPRFRWNHLRYSPWWLGALLPYPIQDKCSPNLSFDAVTRLGEAIFFFKDRYLWIKHNNHNDIKEGPINNFMPRINSTIEAAYWVPQRAVAYLFNGSMFWTVKGSQVKGNPKHISSYGFPSWVQQIDAAVHIRKKSQSLFFTQDLYWRYNENRKVMEDGYPRPISGSFPGISGRVSAGVHKEGFLHIFHGSEVYTYSSNLKHLLSVNKANSWLGC